MAPAEKLTTKTLHQALAGTRGAPYLDTLNPEQREAVETLDGPLLVLAGAGTGKTRVLTTRLAHILNLGKAKPGELLAVTFTNKAAREMKERIGALVGPAVEGMSWLGTFHSLSAQILRRHAELADLRPNFTILDTDDQIRLLKQLLAAERLDEKRWPARVLASLLDGWKNRALAPDQVPAAEGASFADGRAQALYAAYQARLKELNAADFGDLLLETIRVLQANPDVLERYQQRFHYLLVDEYQDTNVAQYLWLRLLAQGRRNVCCVGDDDQSIYGWRGAEVENILRFEKDFPGAKVIRLERNYRSTGHILAAASGLIAANEDRLGKTLWTEGEKGDPVQVRGLWDGEEEARAISDAIETRTADGNSPREMAVLVRASFQMREIEDRFIMLGLPYRVVGGPRFYERAEIRDANAYLRLVSSDADDLAFERIVNKPKRGLGAATVQKIVAAARAARMPLLAAARALVASDELPTRARSGLAQFVGLVDRWAALATELPHTELAEIILDESGYTAMWQNDRSADAPGKLDNLKELIRSMEQFGSLGEYLEHISLVMELEEAATADKVTLMTLHSAKGLEFETVFLPGWEEGLFPHQRALDEQGLAGLEEERRLAYVGLTRAKREAIVSFAANRRIHGMWQSALPSRFISEIPEDHAQVEVETGLAGGGAYAPETPHEGSYPGPGWRRMVNQMRAQEEGGFRARPQIIEETAELVATSDPSAAQYDVGERIFHQKFGYGRISGVDGNKLTVDFEKAGVKRVIDSFVERHGV